MWGLLKWLFLGGCQHSWIMDSKRDLCKRDADGIERETGIRVILRCEKCGDFQKRDLI